MANVFISKSLRQPFRKNMLSMGAGWRGFFAPFDYVTAAQAGGSSSGPTILDLQRQGPFSTLNPPSGFADLGWIKSFTQTPGSKIGQVGSGYLGAIRAQYRSQVSETFEFQFREMGRLQYKLASGCQVFNLLAGTGGNSTTSPLGSAGTAAVSMGVSGYVASGSVAGYLGQPTLYVPSGSGANFPANTYIVCDADYPVGTAGLVGEDGALIVAPGGLTDVDFIRKTSDFVARVVAVATGVGSPAQDALILDQVFVGGGAPVSTTGTPPSTAKVQKIVGWTSREGASFIQDWSGLFVCDTIDGAQMAIYYPHVSIQQNKALPTWTLENAGTSDMVGVNLDCVMTPLAFDDPLDGETITSYSAFYPNYRIQNTY